MRKIKVTRTFRIDGDLYDEALHIADQRDEYLAEVIRKSIERYVARNRNRVKADV